MCMFVVAGRKATADGSVLMAYNNDYDGNNALHVDVVPRREWPAGSMVALSGGQEIAQQPITYSYTRLEVDCEPKDEGKTVFCEGGLNEHQVGAVYGTWLNPYAAQVEAADPPVKDGIGDELWSLILERCTTAREGIDLLAELLTTYGTGEESIGSLAIGDPDEVWVAEQAGGRHWAAARLPDDSYYVQTNMPTIRRVDLSERERFRGPSDLVEFAQCVGTYDPEKDGEFDFARAYGAMDTLTATSNVQRLWWGQQVLTPSAGTDWREPYERRRVFLRPDSLVTAQTVIRLMRSHYEDSPADLSNDYELGSPHYTHRAPCHGTTNYCALWQLRRSLPGGARRLPDGVGGLLRVAPSCPCGSVFVPFYVGSTETAAEYRIGNADYDDESAFWVFRRINNLLSGHYKQLIPLVRETWETWERDRFAEQAAVEREAVDAYARSTAEGESFLTDYCLRLQRDAFEIGRALIGRLETAVVGVCAGMEYDLPDRSEAEGHGSLRYRQLALGEERIALDLVLRVFDESVRPDFSPAGVAEFERTAREFVLGRLPNHAVTVAADGDRLVGVVDLRDASHVALFFVEGDRQKSGIGRGLLEHALARARADGHPPTAVTVNSSPGAVGAYEHLGFVADGPQQELNGIRFVPMTRDL